MHRAFCIAIVSLLLQYATSHAQQKKVELKANGWGSLSGKVTFAGVIPQAKPFAAPNGVPNNLWVIQQNKAIANVIVWVSVPKGTYLPIHEQFKKRKDHVVVEAKNLLFEPRVTAYNPEYFDGKQMVSTKQKFTVKNPDPVAYHFRLIGTNPENALNRVLPAKTEFEPDLKPERLPLNVQSDLHTWIQARVFVCDHPYYAITKADGTFEMPFVPAGAELKIVAWHEAVGYVLRDRAMTLKKGKNTLDFQVP